MKTTATLLALALLSTFCAVAQKHPGPLLATPVPPGFEENKGQVTTPDGQPVPFVKYRLSQGGANVFLLNDGIAYQFNHTRFPEGYQDALAAALHDPRRAVPAELRAQVRNETYRMDMVLEGADPHARITATGRSADHTNYCTHAALDVHAFREVTYHDVYPGIDRVVRLSDNGIEQDFVVRPGADPSRIRMRFTHQEELRLDESGGLVFGNRLGRFHEQRPVSVQNGRTVGTRFVLEGNTLGFDVDAYDRERVLVIDPPLQWATYYGGEAGDQCQAVTLDASGNVYLTGWTTSTGAIASGGYQMSFAGGAYDGIVVKFNADGDRLWGTYYGGAGDDAFRGAAVDGEGNIYASGITTSEEGIALNAHQPVKGDTTDALLVKLDSAGLPLWATYYGGDAEDRGRWCSVDGNGAVYLTGLTASLSGISTVGSHQEGSGGFQDAFLVKFNAAGERQWGTYYGGSSDEQAMGCATDASGNTYIAGGTGTSTGTSIATADSHQPDFGAGGSDAFLAKFSTHGDRLWGTYYGGDAPDFGFACSVDPAGNVFTTGDALSGNGTSIATEGAHQTTHGGGVDAYLVKFNSAGERQWGTYYGDVAGEFGRGCFADINGTVYLVGETESTSNISTPGAYQETFGGAPVDVFLARFFVDGSRDFGTYYGGEAQDYASSGAIDSDGNTYLLGVTGSLGAISTPDSHQPEHGGGIDAFLAKFGAPLDCLGEPNGGALPATPCDDLDACTVNDTWSDACACVGTFADVDADGLCDVEDPCPALPFLATGDPCDDGNANTSDDTVNSDCACFGVLAVDCEGNAGGPAQPGTPCADNDPCTVQEAWGLTCTCTGVFQDSDGDGDCDALDSCPNTPGQIGDACDDEDPCTVNDVLNDGCACIGSLQDSDGDGLCDGLDPCPMGAFTIPGAGCDDGDICTTGDAISIDCVCEGFFVDTDGDGFCDAQDLCPTVPGQPGATCDDDEDCTTDDVITTDCVCAGTPLAIGGIAGEDWVAGDSTTTFSIAPVPGATAYSWDPLPAGWSSTNTSQAELLVTAPSTSGIAQFCVTVYITTCALDTCISVQVSGVGIAEGTQGTAPWYSVRPNPSEGVFTLARASGAPGGVTFTVLDATGRTVRSPNIPAGPPTAQLDLGDVAPGVYFLRMARGAETQVLRLMVRR